MILPPPEEPLPLVSGHGDLLDLVVGSITSPDVRCVSNLLESLSREMVSRDDVDLKVVLLENGGHDLAFEEATQGRD